MDQGGYYHSQSYEGYGDYMFQQGHINAPSISPCTIQAPPPNNYYDAQFQDHYPPQPYQDSPCYSQPLYHSPYPQQYQDPQYASYDQYSQYSHDYNPPQHPFPPQDYSQNPYPSPIHYTPYPNDTQPPYDHYNHSPSVGSYGIDEETLALARRWGVTIVPNDEIEDDGYPMRQSEEEYANNQWEIQEPFYQEPPQTSQPIDEEMRHMMNTLLMQMNELQVQLENIKAQRQGLATQEPIQELPSNGEVLQELFFPNEGHVVDENEEESEDKDDDDDEKVDEKIEMETLNWEEGVELNENGDNEGKEQLQNVPIEEEVLKENEIDRMHEENEETPSMDENFLGENFTRIWEPGGVEGLKSFGSHWPIFQSRNSHFLLVHEKDPRLSLLANEKESQEEKRGGDQGNDQAHGHYQDPKFRKKSLVDLWIKNGFEERGMELGMKNEGILTIGVVNLILKELIDDHHLKCYLEEKVEEKEKEMKIEEDSIFLKVDHCNFFEENMLLLSLKEFLNARHLRTFIEEKVDGEKELIFIQSCVDSSLRRLSRASDIKLSASWEAPHAILHFIAFYFLLYFSL